MKPKHTRIIDGIPCMTVAEHEAILRQLQAQEPVAWMTHSDDLMPLFHRTKEAALNWSGQPTPLYTAPRQWVGLTDEEIEHIADSEYEEAFVRLTEAKLKEKNEAN